MVPMIEPDYSEANGIPDGDYPATIKSAEQRVSKNTGNPYIAWTFEVDTGSGRPVTVFHNTPLAGKGAGYLREMVQAAFDASYQSGPVNTDNLLGRGVTVSLVKQYDQAGNPAPYSKIAKVSAATNSSQNPIVKEQASEDDIPF